MKKTILLFSGFLALFLTACGDSLSNVSEKELPTLVFAEIANLKSYDVNYEGMLAQMEQDMSGGGGKPQTQEAKPGSVNELFLQFNEQGDKYSVALAQYRDISSKLRELGTGLSDGTISAADGIKLFPPMKRGLEASVKTMDEIKPKLDEIQATYYKMKGITQ